MIIKALRYAHISLLFALFVAARCEQVHAQTPVASPRSSPIASPSSSPSATPLPMASPTVPPVASPIASPSPTYSPTETPEPEFCSLDGPSTVEGTIDLVDVVSITQVSASRSGLVRRPKSDVRPLGEGKKVPPLEATLVRQCCTNGCTTGKLTMPGFSCDTLELPNVGNKRDVSCIPPGRYVCRRVRSPKFKNTFEITEVENRCNILFHSGNRKEHTKGCVLLGMQVNCNHNAIGRSKEAMAKFMQQLEGVQSFVITIKEQFKKPKPSPIPTYSFR